MNDIAYITALLEEVERRDKGNIFGYMFPNEESKLTPGKFPHGNKLFEGVDVIYPRRNYTGALDFFSAGAKYNQRLFMAGNRLGKTTSAAYELVCHLTGRYPDWWVGKKYSGCSDWWVIGKSSETTRDVLQALLLGPVGAFGTGMIPIDCIDFKTLTEASKASTHVGIIKVKHISGSLSTVGFKSFDQGRQSFEGTAKSIWIDEEPPLPVYSECLLRTLTGNNMLMMTFTPLKGASETVLNFFPEGDVGAVGNTAIGKWVTRVSMDDVPHLDKVKIEELLAGTPQYQRDARRHGIPALGSGAIYPFEQASYVIDPFEIPKHWKKAYGFDVGRNTAAVWVAEDPDSKNLYVYSEMFQVEGTIGQHVETIQTRGGWLTGAIDSAAHGRSETDGENLFEMYNDRGLNVVNADKAVEAGLYEVMELFTQGRLKIFSTCQQLLKEIRGYNRDEKGRIIKANDHLCDAFRYAIFTRDSILKQAPHKKPGGMYQQSRVFSG